MAPAETPSLHEPKCFAVVPIISRAFRLIGGTATVAASASALIHDVCAEIQMHNWSHTTRLKTFGQLTRTIWQQLEGKLWLPMGSDKGKVQLIRAGTGNRNGGGKKTLDK